MTYFITENYLKLNTTITANVDVTDLVPFVKTASDMSVQPILGSYFYADLLTKYNNQTLDAKETILVDYIKPCVAWQVCSDAVIGLSRQLKNKGLQSQNGDFSNSADFREITFYCDHYAQKKDFYINRLVNHLHRFGKDFEAFISELNKDSNMYPTNPTPTSNGSFFTV